MCAQITRRAAAQLHGAARPPRQAWRGGQPPALGSVPGTAAHLHAPPWGRKALHGQRARQIDSPKALPEARRRFHRHAQLTGEAAAGEGAREGGGN